MMRAAGDRPDGLRLRGLIVVLWRAGLRISEALAGRSAISTRHAAPWSPAAKTRYATSAVPAGPSQPLLENLSALLPRDRRCAKPLRWLFSWPTSCYR